MFDFLLQLDRSLFTSVNSLPHNFLLDSIMLFFSASSYMLIFWIYLVVFYIAYYGLKEYKMIAAGVICTVLTIILVNSGLKNIVDRSRPLQSVNTTIEIGSHIGSGSFPSTHAALSFGLAYVTANFHARRKFYLFLLAFLISFSRLYLGKHYPSDVVAGAVIGIIIGFISLRVVNSTLRQPAKQASSGQAPGLH